MDAFCKKESQLSFYTTDDTETFNKQATIFFEKHIQSKHADLNG
jgi:hypothetical protein